MDKSQKVVMPTTQSELIRLFGVRYLGKVRMYLTPAFAIKQGVTYNDLRRLKVIHRRRYRLFDKIKAEDDPKRLKKLAEKITDIDFDLQEAWGFERDEKFHTWWYRLPKCICPKIDNRDCVGTVLRYTSHDCPLHGLDDEDEEVTKEEIKIQTEAMELARKYREKVKASIKSKI